MRKCWGKARPKPSRENSESCSSVSKGLIVTVLSAFLSVKHSWALCSGSATCVQLPWADASMLLDHWHLRVFKVIQVLSSKCHTMASRAFLEELLCHLLPGLGECSYPQETIPQSLYLIIVHDSKPAPCRWCCQVGMLTWHEPWPLETHVQKLLFIS